MISLDNSAKVGSVRVLHVDDNSDILEISKAFLTDLDNGFEIDFACCVDEAFKKLATKEYDVVVSDYDMPQKDGLEFLKEFHEKNIHVPFILFTGKGREEVAIKALNLGADGYYNKQGSPETVYGELLHGIYNAAELSKAKKTAWENQEKFKKSFEISPDACYMGTLEDGVIVDVNDALLKIYGYQKEECIGKTILQLNIYAKGSPDRQRMLAEIKSKGYFKNLEFYAGRKNGDVFPVLVSETVLEINNKKFVLGVVRDISEEKKKEQALIESEEKFQSLFEQSPIVLEVYNKEGLQVQVNRAYEKLWNFPRERTLGKYNTLDSKQVIENGWLPYLQRAYNGEIVEVPEHEFDATLEPSTNGMGRKRWLKTTIFPLKDKDKQTINIVLMSEDVTERKEAEDKIKIEQENLESVTQSIGADTVIIRAINQWYG